MDAARAPPEKLRMSLRHDGVQAAQPVVGDIEGGKMDADQHVLHARYRVACSTTVDANDRWERTPSLENLTLLSESHRTLANAATSFFSAMGVGERPG
jgi:hypothetical protein